MADVDVLIAGGGPAGCATALSLRAFAPSLRVVVVDAGTPHAGHLGETLPPQAAAFLDHLGLSGRFVGDGHAPAYRTLSAWGTDQPVANEFLYGLHQTGWRLDRTRFDAMLVDELRLRGVGWCATSVRQLRHDGGMWQLRFADGARCTARFVVDATGRRAHLCRRLGISAQRLDRLIACVARFPPGLDPIDLTLETVADGWWYATDLPWGERIVACLSDADIIRRRRLAGIEGWLRSLDTTRTMRELVAGAAPLEPPRTFAASSRLHLLPDDMPFLAVGDAASSFDPLSSQGISKALRSGVFASYAMADFLGREDASGLARYRSFIIDEFTAYRRTLGDFYRRETRWSHEPFWQRRHALRDGEESHQASPLAVA